MAPQTAQSSLQSAEPAGRRARLYRFYLLRADDHIARRREDCFADDVAAMAAARCVMGDYPGVEIWCERRKVITLSRDEAERLEPPRRTIRATQLIDRNHRLLQLAAQMCGRTDALRARQTARQHSHWATLTWQLRRG